MLFMNQVNTSIHILPVFLYSPRTVSKGPSPNEGISSGAVPGYNHDLLDKGLSYSTFLFSSLILQNYHFHFQSYHHLDERNNSNIAWTGTQVS